MKHCVIQCCQAKSEHFIWQVTNSFCVGWCFPAWHKCAPLQNAASWAFWCSCVLTWAPQHVLDLCVSLSLGHLNVLLCYGFHWKLLDILLRRPANDTPMHAHNDHFYVHLSLRIKPPDTHHLLMGVMASLTDLSSLDMSRITSSAAAYAQINTSTNTGQIIHLTDCQMMGIKMWEGGFLHEPSVSCSPDSLDI